MNKPIPYDEDKIEGKFWVSETWEVNIPPKGFVTDFVLATRGFSTPTKFCTWTALFLLSSVLKRDAELDWKPLKLYPNLFIFIVAPPYFYGKSSALNWSTEEILSKFHNYIKDPVIRVKRKITNLLHSKTTPQGLFKLLTPTKQIVKDVNGKHDSIDLGSNVTAVVSELATFLGKRQFNIGLIQDLTDLYDCRATDSNMTLSRGQEELRNIYVTLCGATTQDGLEASIPEAAFGEGFLSRVIIVSADAPTRCYSRPRIVLNGPSIPELCRRLAWIAENAVGTYSFSEKAEVLHERWHNRFQKAYTEGKLQPGRERDSVHLRKLALLIRAQRYEEGTIITVEDFQAAVRLIKSIQQDAKETTNSLRFDERSKKVDVIRKYIRRRGEVERRPMQMALSSRSVLRDDIDKGLRELQATGEIKIYLGGKEKGYPSQNGEEIYKWMK